MSPTRIILQYLLEQALDDEYEDLDSEADEAIYCRHYGPCAKCRGDA